MSHLTLFCLLIAFLHSLQVMEKQEMYELTYQLTRILEVHCTAIGKFVGYQV